MKVRYLDGTEVQTHPVMGNALIAAKLAVFVPTVKKKPTIADVNWLAVRGPVTGGIEEPPYLYFHCKGCGEKHYAEGPTAHKTTQIRHCGIVSTVPSHVAGQYAQHRQIHDRAVKENTRKAEIAAKFESAKKSAIAAARA